MLGGGLVGNQSELAFRLLCRHHGATLAYTPMFLAPRFAAEPRYREMVFQTCPGMRGRGLMIWRVNLFGDCRSNNPPSIATPPPPGRRYLGLFSPRNLLGGVRHVNMTTRGPIWLFRLMPVGKTVLPPLWLI